MLFDLSLIEIVSRLLLGGGIGFCIGLTGVGGGVFMLPALTLFFGMEPITAVGTVSLYSFLTKASATWHHVKLKTIDWKIAGWFLIGAVPANIGVALWVTSRAADEAFNQYLKVFIAGVICFSLLVMLVNIAMKRAASIPQQILSQHLGLRHVLTIFIGAIVGGLIGATSIGGGVLIIPTLMIVFGLSSSRTVGTSIVIAVVLTLITAIIYGVNRDLDWPTVMISTAGSLVMVYFGSKLAVRFSDRMLRWIVWGLMALSAFLMVSDVVQ
jgi:uncharacterized membrane protein YfcA